MKISFITPLHNEEKNVQVLLNRLILLIKKHNWQAEIIPVNDKSSDKTGEILNRYAEKFPFIKPVHRRQKASEKEGNTMGKALQEGTKKATGEVVVWTMGDCSDDLATYPAIVNKLSQGYDMVFASRYMEGGSKGNLDTLKAFLSRWGTILARSIFGITVHDITNAFRGFKKEVFLKTKPRAGDFAISPEFAIRAHLAGFKLGEVPTVYHNRVEGISSFKLVKMTLSYLTIYIKLFSYRLMGR